MLGNARAMLGMLSGWARTLRQAKFRDASFYVESYGGTTGRRGPDHEYPSRDIPYSEDLGRRQRVWRITGYVLGDNYPQQRDALIKACEQAGAGKFIHPTIGEVEAVCRSCSYTEERERGRYCAFELEFHEAGHLREPAEQTDPDSAVGSTAEAVTPAAESSFLKNFSVQGATQWLTEAIGPDIMGVASTLAQLRLPDLTASQGTLGTALSFLRMNAGTLGGNSSGLFGALSGAFAAFGEAGEALRVVTGMLSFVRPSRAPPRGSGELTPWSARLAYGGVSKPFQIQKAQNAASFEQATHRLALREIGYAVTGVDLDNHDQAVALLGEITAAFRQVEEAAADAGDDDVFWAITGLRNAITRMLAARSVNLNPLTHYKIVSETPANSLWLAWRLYQDSGRDLELVRRTACRTPAFMPMTGRVLAS